MSEGISDLLRKWIATTPPKAVVFQEIDSPVNDPLDDYSVKYEARFKPSRPEQAEVGITLTSDDFIGIGFETRADVARRLNVRNSRQGYAAGFEPSEKSKEQLLLFLDLVRDGKIAIRARCWPLIGLGGTNAVIQMQNSPPNFEFGPRGWLQAINGPRSMVASRILFYEAWS